MFVTSVWHLIEQSTKATIGALLRLNKTNQVPLRFIVVTFTAYNTAKNMKKWRKTRKEASLGIKKTGNDATGIKQNSVLCSKTLLNI